jgi:hypothetical protein
MKKLVALMIGMSLVLGSATLFAQIVKGDTKTAPSKNIKTNDKNKNIKTDDKNENKNFGKKVEDKVPPVKDKK